MEKERYDGYNRDKTEPSDLYEDLPKEVVDILMETHPLMGKNEQQDGATIYRRRTRQNNEQTQVSQDTTSIDWSGAAGEETVIGRRTRRRNQEEAQQYTTRFQPIQSETEQEQNTYDTQINYQDETGYDETIYQTQVGLSTQYDNQQQNDSSFDYSNGYDDTEQTTAYMPYTEDMYDTNYQQNETYDDYTAASERRERHGPLMQEIEITLPSKNSQQEQHHTATGRRGRSRNFEDFDLERGAKQLDLNELYSDDYEDEERITFRPSKKFGVIFSVIAIVLIGFLGFRCISLGGKLKTAEQTIAENENLKTQYETLQMDKLKLEEELQALKNGGTATEPDAQSNQETTTDTGNFDWYTTTASDTSWWGLAEKFYGDGTQYQKILDANGKTESDYLKAGERIKIPK